MSENPSKARYVFSDEPEIIRQNQQDDYFQGYLKSKVVDALEIFTPWLINYRLISRNEDIIKMITGLLYYSLTTLRSTQTLGEEYSKLAQYNPNYKGVTWQNYPNITKTRKVMFVLFASVFPVISERVIKKIYNSLKQRFAVELRGHAFLKIVVKNLPDYDSFVQSLFKLHLAIFFIEGAYLQISKRITSIKYVYTRKPQDHGLSFHNVGRLMILQIAIEFIKFFYKCYKSYAKKKGREAAQKGGRSERKETRQSTWINTDESKTCPLCFDPRKNSACTPCGHLFCWDCIMKNCLIKEECPQCRKTCKPNKIIQIRNM